MNIAKIFRFHHWIKNAIIFLPFFLFNQLLNINILKDFILGFFLFSLCASSVYILNDILGINNDKYHYSKKNRPISSLYY